MGTERTRALRRVILAEGAVNAVTAAAKVAVGLSSGSLALLSDALHSGADLANNALAWKTVSIAEAPPDSEHPYGHAKFESLAVFGLGVLMAVLAVEIVLGAAHRVDGETLRSTPLELGVIVATLGLQISVAVWQAARARALDSELLRADAAHTFVDSATTVGALAGWQLAVVGLAWLDSALAIVIAALVVGLAYRLFRRAIPILVDGAAVDPAELRATVAGVPGVLEVGLARSRWDGRSRIADVTIRVDPGLDTTASHAVADAVERRLADQHAIHETVVHVEPATGPH
ncbi:MAG: cation diffusion facilitator family transporter [Planctomycetota bacterium]